MTSIMSWKVSGRIIIAPSRAFSESICWGGIRSLSFINYSLSLGRGRGKQRIGQHCEWIWGQLHLSLEKTALAARTVGSSLCYSELCYKAQDREEVILILSNIFDLSPY